MIRVRTRRVPSAAVAIAAALALTLGLGPTRPAAAATGEQAPTFVLNTLEGKPIDTAKLKKEKRAALMVFWASW